MKRKIKFFQEKSCLNIIIDYEAKFKTKSKKYLMFRILIDQANGDVIWQI